MLRSKDIVNYGEDIEEQFLDLIQVSENHREIIFLKKFQKYVNTIK